ncbi:MAG: T9SS type A sorting domain-containing protein [Candidatus Marinimicrobia bacterium]|nr:T9SS type A sorting domain-containing protein [Candidatus Neomarinimicrobiota bacterium]
MKKIIFLSVFIFLTCFSHGAISYTTIDNFNRTDNTTLGTTSSGNSTWTENEATDHPIQLSISGGVLKAVTDGVSGLEPTNASINLTSQQADYDFGYDNTGWSFHFDLNNNPSGWTTTYTSLGWVLITNEPDFSSETVDGYAVIWTGTDDQLVLISFENGISGTNPGTIVVSTGLDWDNISVAGINIRVEYTVPGTWQMFWEEGDPISSPIDINANSASGTSSLFGDDVNMVHSGPIWAHGTSTASTAIGDFDNFSFGCTKCTTYLYINEIRADDVSTDDKEFIELIGKAGTNLLGYTLKHYNGTGSVLLWSLDLSGTIPNDGDQDNNGNNLGYWVIATTASGSLGVTPDQSASGSLQNGPDGLELLFNGTRIQALVYGTDTGDLSGGSPAWRLIGEEDSGDNSLSAPNIFGEEGKASWNLETATPGTRNTSQTSGDMSLPVSLQDFNAVSGNSKVTLSWVTESETENLGFNLYRGTNNNGEFLMLNAELIAGHGSTSERHEYSYVDRDVVNGVTYCYKLEDVDYAGKAKLHDKVVSATPASKESDANINEFRLYPCYPNPFNPETTLRFELTEAARISVQIYDLLGNRITTLTNAAFQPGEHNLTWNGRDHQNRLVGTGIYFLQISGDHGISHTEKVIFLR